MQNFNELLQELNVSSSQKGCHSGKTWYGSCETIRSFSPVDGSELGTVSSATVEDYENAIAKAEHAFLSFRKIPAPKRGEMVRQLGNKLRKKTSSRSIGFLGNGKILTRRSWRSSRNDRHL